MPNNSISHCFVENYNRTENGQPTLGSQNVEEQIRVAAQSALTIRNLDAEGSKFRLFYGADCVMQFQGLHIEHIEVDGTYPNLLYLGGGTYGVHGAQIDGLMLARNVGANPSFSTIFSGDHHARITLSGVRARPFPPAGAVHEDWGFLPLNGLVVLVHTDESFVGGATFHFLDRPDVPVYPLSERGTQIAYAGTAWNYREAQGWVDNAGGTRLTSATDITPVKARRTLNFASIAAGGVGLLRLGECVGPVTDSPELAPLPGAVPGDLVTLGPPANLPGGLVASGVVLQPGCVEIRLFNATAAAVDPPEGAWTLSVGGGPGAGEPQITTDSALLAASGHSVPPA